MTSNVTECYIYRGWRRNQTDLIVSGYEGVPQNLILNLVCWVIMLITFSILRKRAWNYGRIALIERDEAKWPEMFYGSGNFTPNMMNDDNSSPPASHSQSATNNNSKAYRARAMNTRAISLDADLLDTGLFKWVKISFTISDRQFTLKSGPDAVQYLSYQRHLIFLASIMTVISLIFILPIHLQGNEVRFSERPDLFDFRQSTIQNLSPGSKFLWVHVVLSMLFVCLSILVMRHFSKGLEFVSRSVTRSVIITGIGKKASRQELYAHFQEVYPGSFVEEISFAYDVSRLQSIEDSIESSERSQRYCIRYFEKNRIKLYIRPHFCGAICICCHRIFKIAPTDAIEYYEACLDKYRKKAEIERKHVLLRHIGIAFITFRTVEIAENMIKDHRTTAKCFHQTPISKQSQVLKSNRWNASFAPAPDDIQWQNLSQGTKTWVFKLLTVNSILFILSLFVTTPVILLNALNNYLAIKRDKEPDEKAGVSGIIRDTVPTVLLWLAAVTLPSLVSVTDRIIGFWTKTAENRSKMIKTFTFLLFMVVILPSLGITHFYGFLTSKTVQWDCIFASTNTSFFIHYVITSCFIGTASELLRLPELFIYMIRLCFTRSKAEMVAVRKYVLWEFQIGTQYAWLMLNFAIFTLFSLIAPVITPFGLLYLIMKHYVDRHNIYFAYSACKVDKQVHGTAINFVIVSMFLLQVILLSFINSGTGASANKPLQAFSVIGLSITAALFVGQVFFNMCANFSPILYHESSVGDETGLDFEMEEEEGGGLLLPPKGRKKWKYFPHMLVSNSHLQTNPPTPSTSRSRLINIRSTTEIHV